MLEAAKSLIEREGVYGLCASDGCPCASFQVHYVNVEISCHKSGWGPRIYVSSGSMDWDVETLSEIGEIVRAQVAESCGIMGQTHQIRLLNNQIR